MRSVLSTIAAVLALLATPILQQSLCAQSGPPSSRGSDRYGRGEQSSSGQRDQLEKRFQERLDSIVKTRLNLSDEQHARLREIASRIEESRRQLRREEMEIRMGIWRELMAGDKASEKKMGELLDRVPKVDRRRVELTEQEQKELSKFLTPIQRARYIGLQEELRRSMQEMQYRRMPSSRRDHW